jgi:ribosomal protein L18E
VVKVLGSGELTRAVTVSAHAFSRRRARRSRASGGRIEEIG